MLQERGKKTFEEKHEHVNKDESIPAPRKRSSIRDLHSLPPELHTPQAKDTNIGIARSRRTRDSRD